MRPLFIFALDSFFMSVLRKKAFRSFSSERDVVPVKIRMLARVSDLHRFNQRDRACYYPVG